MMQRRLPAAHIMRPRTGLNTPAVLPKLDVEWCTAWNGTINMLPLHQHYASVKFNTFL